MGKVWGVLMLAAAGAAMMTGNIGSTADALMSSGDRAVAILLTLLASMTLWNGLMEILEASGDMARLGRVFRRTLQPLFPGITDEAAWNALSMNLAANIMGLGNAATPAGIEAAKRLAALGDTGMRALAMLLVLDNAGLQLIPTTVLSLRQAAGSTDPGSIWGTTLLVSAAASVAAVLLMKLCQAGGEKHGRNLGRSVDTAGGRHCSARRNDRNGCLRRIPQGR